mgnify:CR=1 FL=1
MKRLLLLLSLALAQPAAADFGKQFYRERIDAVNSMVRVALRAKEAGDIDQLCLEIGSAGRVLGVYLTGMNKHFPGTDWFAYKKKLRGIHQKYECAKRGHIPP